MGESIENKTLRGMVEDRDLALVAREMENDILRRQIESLQGELKEAWKHPLSKDEEMEKAAFKDYGLTMEFVLCRFRGKEERSLFEMICDIVEESNLNRRGYHAYASAYSTLDVAFASAKRMVEENP